MPSPVQFDPRLIAAAASLWDPITDPRTENSEYLRGQVETIMYATNWPEDTDLGADGPRAQVEAAIIAAIEKYGPAKPARVALHVDETMTDSHGEYHPVAVKEGEPGYYLTNYSFGADFTLAKRLVEEANAVRGITPDDARQIIASSFAAGTMAGAA